MTCAGEWLNTIADSMVFEIWCVNNVYACSWIMKKTVKLRAKIRKIGVTVEH
jgi:hypothetical protein